MSLPLLHAGKSAPGLSAALDLRFALDKSLTAYRGPTPSFSRASTGTYFNSSGVLTSAAINAARFNHTYNGTSWISKGLLIEEQRTNLLSYSQNLANAYWTKSAVSISGAAAVSPDGTSNAEKIVESATTAYHSVNKTGITTSGAATASIYLKAAGRNYASLEVIDNHRAVVNLTDGTVVSNSFAGSTLTATNVGNGWYRFVYTGTGIERLIVYLLNSSSFGQYAGDGSSGVYAWGAQVENGAFATTYIPSLSNSSTTRSADVCQITGTDFSGFYNANEGSVCFEGDSNGSTASIDNYFLICSDGSTFNNAAPFVFSSGSLNSLRHRVRAGAVDIFNITTSEQLARSTQIKLAQGYKSGDSVILANGSIIDSRTNSFSTSGISTFYIGHAHSGLAQINGHIARLRYYRKRLPNATLQQLST